MPTTKAAAVSTVCAVLLAASIGAGAGAQGDPRPMDWGDAPDGYPVTRAESGARHVISSGYLGNTVDAEDNGVHSTHADWDDNNGTPDDEDGVSVSPDPLVACGDAILYVSPSRAGFVDAWMDFNGDDVWDYGFASPEQIAKSTPVYGAPGATVGFAIPFVVPCYSVGTVNARVRFSFEGNLLPIHSGGVPFGEVEDHQFEVVHGAELAIDKTDHRTSVPAGSPLKYEITVTNHGPLPATQVTMSDVLPGGVMLAGLPAECAEIPPGSGEITCVLPTLPPSASHQFDIDVITHPNTNGVLVNVASVTAQEPDPGEYPNEAVDETLVYAPSGTDYGDAPGSYTQIASHGVSMGWPLLIGAIVDTEAMHQASPDATADDDVDADDEDAIVTPLELGRAGRTELFIDASDSGLLSAWIDTDADSLWDPAERVFTNRPLRAGSNRLTFPVPTTPGAVAQSVARLRFATDAQSSPGGAAVDGEVEDHKVVFSDNADLEVTKSTRETQVCASVFLYGSDFHYIVTVKNNGPSAATGVVLTDNLDPNVLFWAVWNTPTSTIGPNACNYSPHQITCQLGTIPAGSSVDVIYKVEAPQVAQTVTNTAVVTSTSNDPNIANNTATLNVMVVECPLIITKTDDPDPVVNGETLEYFVTVFNPGDDSVTDVVMTDTLPPEVGFVSAAPTNNNGPGACNSTPDLGESGQVVCTWPYLPPQGGEWVTIRVTTSVDPPPLPHQCKSILNIASASATDHEGNPLGPVLVTEPTDVCADCDVDVVLLMDVSGSMGSNFSRVGDPPSKYDAMKAAGLEFHNDMTDPQDPAFYTKPSQVALASFESTAQVDQVLTPLTDPMAAALASLRGPVGGTNIANGLAAAIDEIQSIRHLESNVPVIVLLSDGAGSGGLQVLYDSADAAKAAGIQIVSIAVDPLTVEHATLLRTIASPGLYFEAFSADQLVDIYEVIQAEICGGGSESPGVCGDLGDAPDSSNHFGQMMHTEPGGVVDAHFPTVFDVMTGAPVGPRHAKAQEDVFLGFDVTCEDEADLYPDEDNLTNIAPLLDLPNFDLMDDGLWGSIDLPQCAETSFDFRATSMLGPDTHYVNAWFDFNRDGDWEDTGLCNDPVLGIVEVPEWAVQNHVIAPPTGSHVFGVPAFRAAPDVSGCAAGQADLWMRLMLSEAIAVGPPGGNPDGRGPAEGYEYGETEDFLLHTEPPCQEFWP